MKGTAWRPRRPASSTHTNRAIVARPLAGVGRVVFQPRATELPAEERLLNEPTYKGARDKIVAFVTRLQEASAAEDYVELHRSLLANFIAYQETADEALTQRMETRRRIRELAGEEPKPIEAIQEQQELLTRVGKQEITLKAVHHLIRAVGDGIAWRALRYDRGAFTVLGDGERVGRIARIGRDAELTALANLSEQEGRFAIHNDMTNCSRHGDLTAIREADGEVEVNRSSCGGAPRPDLPHRWDDGSRIRRSIVGRISYAAAGRAVLWPVVPPCAVCRTVQRRATSIPSLSRTANS